MTPFPRHLQNWLREAKRVQPLLLTAPFPTDVRHFSELLVQAAVCRTRDGCTQCDMCVAAAHGAHPDITVFDSSYDGERSSKELRRILSEISRSPFHGRRVVLLPDIDRLSLVALNTLLKPLEEPSPTQRYILTTRYPRRLPATLLSRCQLLAVEPTGAPTTQTKDSLTELLSALRGRLQAEGPTPELRRVFHRLRDYYRIKSVKGNIKLAYQILVAALRQIDHTLAAKYESLESL